MGEGGGGRGYRERKFLSFSSLLFSLPSFPFSPETPDTQATRFSYLFIFKRRCIYSSESKLAVRCSDASRLRLAVSLEF